MNKIMGVMLLAIITAAYHVKKTPEVIIVGAGIAGLRASQVLKQHNVTHIIIESTDHIGGRTTHMQLGDIKVDRGGSFLDYATTSNILAKIVREKKWPYRIGTFSDQFFYFEGEGLVPKADVVSARKKLNKLMAEVHRGNYPREISMREWLDKQMNESEWRQQSNKTKELIRSMLQQQANIDGEDTSQLSARYFQQMDNETQVQVSYIVKPNLATFIHHLLQPKNVEIHFNERVRKIDYSKDVVAVQTAKKTYYARRILSSLPIGVLKAGDVQFYPQLPRAYRQAIDRIGLGYENKLYVNFERPFWKKGQSWLNFAPKGGVIRYPGAFVVPYTGHNTLLFFTSGQESLKLERMSDSDIKQDLINYLSRFSITGIKITDLTYSRWSLDENTKGTYSYTAPNTKSEHFKQLARPIDNRLWIIGQHTSSQANGFTHGAYLSGEHAALEVVKLTKTQNKV